MYLVIHRIHCLVDVDISFLLHLVGTFSFHLDSKDSRGVSLLHFIEEYVTKFNKDEDYKEGIRERLEPFAPPYALKCISAQTLVPYIHLPEVRTMLPICLLEFVDKH